LKALNDIKISSDGVCVYFFGKVKTRLILRIILYVLLLLMFTGALMAVLGDGSSSDKGIIGLFLLLAGSFFLIPMAKYLLWNVYGEELISISTRSVSFKENFGFISPAEKTIRFGGDITMTFNKMIVDNENEYGLFRLFGYNKDGQPELLFTNSVYISKEQFSELAEKIQLIFQSGTADHFGFSMN
jgi:hypothetical protein